MTLPVVDVADVIDPMRCGSCGRCCLLYRSVEVGGGMSLQDVGFEEYCDGWDEWFRESGATQHAVPSHDPLESHAAGNYALRARLTAAGVDIGACQFHGPAGCRLPRHARPVVCRTFACWVSTV